MNKQKSEGKYLNIIFCNINFRSEKERKLFYKRVERHEQQNWNSKQKESHRVRIMEIASDVPNWQERKTIYCIQCGVESKVTAKFCTQCGSFLKKPRPKSAKISTKKKKKSTSKSKTMGPTRSDSIVEPVWVQKAREKQVLLLLLNYNF
jgi:hypothetical protein